MNYNLLKEVLSIKPSTWEDDDYHSKTFSRKEISPSSSEYADVVSAFNTLRSVKKIERVQNPILFGKYKIRKEQLNKRGHNVNEVRCYIAVKMVDIDNALEYNCDPRHMSVSMSTQLPKFYMDPGSIPNDGHEAIIVLSALLTSAERGYFSKSTDTEYYPEYLVLL